MSGGDQWRRIHRRFGPPSPERTLQANPRYRRPGGRGSFLPETMEAIPATTIDGNDGGNRNIPATRAVGDEKDTSRQLKNTRDATKALRDRLKEENKKFDGSDVFSMILFIIVAEEIIEQYNVADLANADLQSPDVVTVMFNNLVGKPGTGSGHNKRPIRESCVIRRCSRMCC